MKKIALLLALSASSAFAHIEPGAYSGKTPDGRECRLMAIRQYFENNVPHPLNERVVVQVGNDPFTVGHPPVVNSVKGIASFDHDFFQGLLPTTVGAKALIIRMNHTEGQEGPTGFMVIDHQWKKDVRTKFVCEGLKLLR